MMDRTAQFYSQPSYVSGGIMPVFSGSRRQRGGSILGSLKNFFMPLFSRLGRRGIKSALGVAQNVATEAISGKNIKASLRQHGLKAAKRLGNEILSDAMGHVNTALSSTSPSMKPRRSRKRVAPHKAKQSAKRVKVNF